MDADAPYGITPTLTMNATQARAWISGRDDATREPGEAVRKLRQDVLTGKVPLGDLGDPSIPGIVFVWLAVGTITADIAEGILRLYSANAMRKAPDGAAEEEA